VGWVVAAGLQDLCGQSAQGSGRGTGSRAGGSGQPAGWFDETSYAGCDIAKGCPQWFGDRVGTLVEVDTEYRVAECSQRESAALGVEVDLLAVSPARADHVGGLSYLPAEGANIVFGEDGLQGAPTGQPWFVFEREEART
jgi:hypothetical protein